MAGKDFTLISVVTFGVLFTNHIALGGLIRPPAVPPFASTLSFYLSPPPPPPVLPAPQLLPSALPLPSPPPFNPFLLPPTLFPSPTVLSGLPLLPNAPLPPFGVNGLRFFSTKGVFPSLLPAYPPVFPAPAPILPPAPFLPPAALPPALLPALPPPALPAPALPAFPPPALPAFPGFAGLFSAGPLPFAPLKHLYRRDVNTPKPK